MNCPCRSGRPYDRCCGRFISHDAATENARQLMRSRYSAYVLGETAYLRQTWHPDHCPVEVAADSRIRWLGLEILASSEREGCARVEFEARFLLDGRVDAMHEDSEFVFADGRWLYTRGEQLAPTFAAWKPARNEDCPCGSGRKFKRCCAVNKPPGQLG